MNRNGLLLWILSGAGVLFVYSAVKNVTPQSVLTAQLGTGVGRVPISGTLPTTPTLTPMTPVYNATSGTIHDQALGKEKLASLAQGVLGYQNSAATRIRVQNPTHV